MNKCSNEVKHLLEHSRDGDGDDDVVELEVLLLELVLDVDVAAALPVVRRPAVDRQRQVRLVRRLNKQQYDLRNLPPKPILSLSTHLESPLQYADVGVEREGLGRVLEADLVLGLEQLLVDVGVRLQLDALFRACNQG